MGRGIRFTMEFKREAVRLVLSSGRPVYSLRRSGPSETSSAPLPRATLAARYPSLPRRRVSHDRSLRGAPVPDLGSSPRVTSARGPPGPGPGRPPWRRHSVTIRMIEINQKVSDRT